jgi:hypothetical protein
MCNTIFLYSGHSNPNVGELEIKVASRVVLTLGSCITRDHGICPHYLFDFAIDKVIE